MVLQKPICVDLDGTLIKTDLLYESFFSAIHSQPLLVLKTPFWLMKGKNHLKAKLSENANIDVQSLPFNSDVVAWLKSENEKGRDVVLATASNQLLANKVADHIGFFKSVYASDYGINLKGSNKKNLLVEKFGVSGFDYMGDHKVDIVVWNASETAHVVGDSQLLNQLNEKVKRGKVFPQKGFSLNILLKSLRVHQWAKNGLVFVPLVFAHKTLQVPYLLNAVLGFLAFCFTASSVYLLNDLIDLSSDRKHPTKKNRPFASGQLSPVWGLILIPLLLALAAGLSTQLNYRFSLVLMAYFVSTLAYSFKLKQIVLVDVVVLAGLFCVRLFAGSVATELGISNWLLTFSLFLFLSLAFLKRFTELLPLCKPLEEQGVTLPGRGYQPTDLEQISSLGSASGYLAVLVVAFYISSPDVKVLYTHHEVLWLTLPIFLYWISRVWLLGRRGQMNHDPVVFALKDRVSYLIGFLLFIIVGLAI